MPAPANGMCDTDMTNSKTLDEQMGSLSIDQTDEKAAMLMDHLELTGNKDPAAQALCLQQIYELRLKSVAASIQGDLQQQQPAAAAATSLPAPAPPASAHLHSSSSSSISADWDASDDWEPDVSCLRSASSFEKERDKPPLLQPFQSSPHPQRRAATLIGNAQPSRFALSEPSTSVRPSSGGGSSRPSSGGGSKMRGRGQSKCGLPTSDSEDEALLLAAQSQPHIVEFHNLNRAITTSHLETFLLDFIWGKTAANIKWVDDEHALAVFPCPEAAQALLESPQKDYKVRPYSRASRAALHLPAEELTPPRAARPKTTTAVARRLISNALGNSQVRDKAAEKELAALRKANKDGKKERQQQLDAAWGEED